MARAHLDQACFLATWRAGFSDYKCSRLSASLKDRCSLLEFCPSSKRAGPSAARRDALVCWGMTRPLISILTPVLNRIDLLGGALDSVRRARGVPSEHLVIDGGSTDGTLSLLRSRPDIRLIEAPGTGIYDALNLGLRAACGDIICQLNSDDLLPAGALEAVAEADARSGREPDAVRGHVLFFADDAAQSARAATLTAEFPVPLRPRDVVLGLPAINALFVRRRLYDRVGYFDPRFRLAADREWLLRAFAAGIRVHEICAYVYCFRVHTGSLTIDPGRSGSVAIRLEHLEISRRVFGSPAAPATLRALRKPGQVVLRPTDPPRRLHLEVIRGSFQLFGAGGMGEVYRALDSRLGREVAIKILHEKHGHRFEREAHLIAALNHPNICRLYDVGPNYLRHDSEPFSGPYDLNARAEPQRAQPGLTRFG